MSNFVKHFSYSFAKNASKSACSSCGTVNTAAAVFNNADFTDTVVAVSVLLCSLIGIISLALSGLISIIILAGIIIINLICLAQTLIKSETLKLL